MFAAVAFSLGLKSSMDRSTIPNVTRELRSAVCQYLLTLDPAGFAGQVRALPVGAVLDELLIVSRTSHPMTVFAALATILGCNFVVYRPECDPAHVSGASTVNKAYHIAIGSSSSYSFVPRRRPLRFSPLPAEVFEYEQDDDEVQEKPEAAGPALRAAQAIYAARQQSPGTSPSGSGAAPHSPPLAVPMVTAGRARVAVATRSFSPVDFAEDGRRPKRSRMETNP